MSEAKGTCSMCGKAYLEVEILRADTVRHCQFGLRPCAFCKSCLVRRIDLLIQTYPSSLLSDRVLSDDGRWVSRLLTCFCGFPVPDAFLRQALASAAPDGGKRASRYERIVSGVDAMPDVFGCPTAGCCFAGFSANDGATHEAFCELCRRCWVLPRAEAPESAQASERWARRNCQLCPHCRAPTQKIDGCNSVTCTRCWQGWNWSSDSSDRKAEPAVAHLWSSSDTIDAYQAFYGHPALVRQFDRDAIIICVIGALVGTAAAALFRFWRS
jgi:hypothetical protein